MPSSSTTRPGMNFSVAGFGVSSVWMNISGPLCAARRRGTWNDSKDRKWSSARRQVMPSSRRRRRFPPPSRESRASASGPSGSRSAPRSARARDDRGRRRRSGSCRPPRRRRAPRSACRSCAPRRNRSWPPANGTLRSVSQTRTSKSVPMKTIRSGRSGRHSFGSKMRRASVAVAASSCNVFGLRPAPHHVGERRLFAALVGEGEAGEPVFRRHDERRAERRGVEAVADDEPFAARAIAAGRHRLVRDEEVVQPARAGEPDLVGGVEHGRGLLQQRARMVERQRLQEGLRRKPGPAREELLQPRRLHADLCGDRLERRLVAPVRGDVFDHLTDDARSRSMPRGRRGVGRASAICASNAMALLLFALGDRRGGQSARHPILARRFRRAPSRERRAESAGEAPAVLGIQESADRDAPVARAKRDADDALVLDPPRPQAAPIAD